MNNLKQLCALIPELIKETTLGDDNIIFSDRAKAIIKEVVEYSKKTPIYKENSTRANEFWTSENKTARNVYAHMLNKIVNAPTSLHRDASVILCIPILDEIVNGAEKGAKL